jgi:predicted RNA-binding protein YlxR (DUF448 family)
MPPRNERPDKKDSRREILPAGPGPWRMCQISRKRCHPSALIRLMAAPAQEQASGVAASAIIVDIWGRGGGRGCWLLPDAKILAAAEARAGQLAKQLRAPGARLSGLALQVRRAAEERMMVRLREAARAGRCRSGATSLSTLPAGEAKLWLVAADAGAGIRAQIRQRIATGDGTIFIEAPLDRAALGRMIGCGPRAATGICAGKAAEDILRWLPQLVELR